MLQDYYDKFDTFTKKAVFIFNVSNGGIGDFFKFFTFALNYCVLHNIRMYYLPNNMIINNFVKLKCNKLYIDRHQITKTVMIKHIAELNNIYDTITDENTLCEIHSFNMYDIDRTILYSSSHIIDDVFYFIEEVREAALEIIRTLGGPYNSIHLRLGDKFLETDESFIAIKDDVRAYDEVKMVEYIKQHSGKSLFFFCDNNTYRQYIKKHFNFINITNLEIGHTSYPNTTPLQIFHTCIEFYILLNSEEIYNASYSSFSIIASKFRNVPLKNKDCL